ncbi:MAG TPA: glucoamylase family protein, partial [Pirellulales bacterium]|nr:glucoamylase family protein [Pirellulales bacterium]
MASQISLDPTHESVPWLISHHDHALRKESFSGEHLEQYARELAQLYRLSEAPTVDRTFIARFEQNAEFLKRAHQEISAAVRAGEPMTAEAEWLLDNFYIVEEQLREVHDDLPHRYFRELPKLTDGSPRVYGLALELISHTDSALDEDTIVRLIQGFQTVTPLTIGEVWAVPIMLRLGLIENLRRLSSQMLVARKCRERATELMNAWQAHQDLDIDLTAQISCAPLVLALLEEIGQRGPEYAVHLRRFERQLADHRITSQDLIRMEHQRQASNQVSIGNVITSMRLISALDWISFFEKTNLADQVLRQDPAEVYAQMDFETRDWYRHVIEDLAKRTKYTDLEIAQKCVAQAAAASIADGDFQRRHVGYYLIDRGRLEFEPILDYRPSVHERLVRALLSHPNGVYLGGIGALTAIFTCCALWAAFALGSGGWLAALIALLGVFPASELAVSLLNLIVTSNVRPRRLPKLELKQGIPSSQATIIVIPSLLSNESEVDALLDRLELHFLANQEAALRFALLTDFPDADEPVLPQDEPLLQRAIRGIRRLNERHGSGETKPFFLFHRRRQWNQSEQKWMGWERKRGKLMEFNQLLRGAQGTSYETEEGDLAFLTRAKAAAIRYVITLDADTQLPYGCAKRLVGTLAHPLNHARFDASKQRIVSGYAILQPRISVNMASAQRSWFAKLFASNPGIDPYSTASSDVYQDLYGEGSFAGKGIYDLNAFEHALQSVFPENAILSHDLIEGCHSRVGLVSDIELVDSYPSRYDAEARRAHRWVRGDWQLWPWLRLRVPTLNGSRPNPLSLLSRWKIFDNLRRSLVPPTVLLFLLVGWLAVPAGAWAWTAMALGVLAFPFLAKLFMTVRGLASAGNWLDRGRVIGRDLGRLLLQSLLTVTFLPHRAWLMTDAAVRTLFRMFISHRHLLEWETASDTERRLSGTKGSFLRHMGMAPPLAVLVGLMLPWEAFWWALPLLLLWVVAPAVAYLVSQPIRRKTSTLSSEQLRWLRRATCKTWTFFEAVTNEQGHWLPPDNLQEYPAEKIAYRVSPTNEGLFFLAGLAARDFGFIPLSSLLEIWKKNLDHWVTLERFHGHFYNWYDTETLRPLPPRYISTVDSGNLMACFLTMRQGTADLQAEPVLGKEQWQGLRDLIDVAVEACEAMQPHGARIVNESLENLTTAVSNLRALCVHSPADLLDWNRLVHALRTEGARLSQRLEEFLTAGEFPSFVVEPSVRQLLRWIEGVAEDFYTLQPLAKWLVPPIVSRTVHQGEEAADSADDARRFPALKWSFSHTEPVAAAWTALWTKLGRARSLTELAQLAEQCRPALLELEKAAAALPSSEEQGEFQAWLAKVSSALDAGTAAARTFIEQLDDLANRMEALAIEMDFRFLYNPQRRLFSIGFNLEDGKLDRSHYDMLASEARLASYLAIAKGDVEPRHWFQLGRPVTEIAGGMAVLSWGGTMFEYMMPALFQRSYDEGLLNESQNTAVRRQQQYGRQHSVPWGISESAYGALAVNADYHYQSFGVPGLGLKRGLAKDLVISPYSTMLALDVDPVAGVENLQALASAGGLGRFGFFDALDYTPERVPAGKRCILVQCYMAHHQGMSLVALANLMRGGIMRQRFHSHRLARATELLLQERMPTAPPRVQPNADEVETVVSVVHGSEEFVCRRLTGVASPAPRTHLLSNGQYSVMLTSTGGGYSVCRELAITRWRPDFTRDNWGQFIYLRDRKQGHVWSATYQPTCVQPDAYQVIYSIDKAEFHRRDGDLETRLEVAVSSENNAEVRQVILCNHGDSPREIELTSYAEVVLNSPAADEAHPAFHKLFVQTEYVAEETALLAKRRQRDSQVPPIWAVHVLAASSEVCKSVQYETSREVFLGRGRTPQAPAALDANAILTGTIGAVLDPIFSLRCTVVLKPNESVTVGFATAFAESREEAMVLADQYHDPRGIQRAFELAWAFCQVDLRHLHMSPARAHLYQRLASAVIYPDAAYRANPDTLRANRQGQSGLWRYGVSGDRPLVALHITRPDDLQIVRDLISAQEYWRLHGLVADLVIVNDYPGSYLDALQEQLVKILNETQRTADHKPSVVVVLRGAQLPREDITLLDAVAAVLLHGDRGSLSQQIDQLAVAAGREAKGKLPKPSRKPADEVLKLEDKSPAHDQPAFSKPASSNGQPIAGRLPLPTAEGSSKLQFWNGYGGFTADGKEYRIKIARGQPTPLPWSNVIASPRFGCVVTESGGGYTWFSNSRENKLTTWSNDPVTDPPAEVLYLTDEAGTRFPVGALRHDSGDYWVHHGQGYSRFLHQDHDLHTETLLTVADDDPVKIIKVTLQNLSREPRAIALTYYCEWVLGVNREQTGLHLQTARDGASGALLVRNPYHPEMPEQVAFLHVLGGDAKSVTGDRTDFLGRNGALARPAALRKERLSGRTGAGLDCCGAVQTHLVLEAGQKTDVVFLLGAADNAASAQDLLSKYSDARAVQSAITATQASWHKTLERLQIRTPHPGLDLLVNRWLPYQVLSCRLWGRSAFYQSGGAYGYRDQLQDVMALVYTRPDLAREHLLRAAARQFEEGDVQHWWHPPTGRGTRTRYSDDYLWLALVACHYVQTTGDNGVLDEVAPYLRSLPLGPHEHERYETPHVSDQTGTLYEHCLRALAHSEPRGPHRLPLIGGGDWNDGMNRIGELGKGESIWVGWFLLVILKRFIPLAQARGDSAKADHFQQQATELAAALEAEAWDGQWYRRAYFDDGTPLGSSQNDECQIDSIAQSWAVMAGANPDRAEQAMHSVLERLVNKTEQLILLFAPPFDKTKLDPGYIKGYLPGIRENGGQYTHSALWVIQALTLLRQPEQALVLLDMLLPVTHARTKAEADHYRAEPYVVAADVYGVAPHIGRGGWTWYTGSAAWMYRVAIESILGLQLRGNRLILRPCLPEAWSQYELTYLFGKTPYHLTVINGASAVAPAGSVIAPAASASALADGNGHAALEPIFTSGIE